MPVEALLDPNSPLPAQIAGHGPIPADIARELLATTAGKKSLRRLVTRDGIVIGGDSRRRTFDGALETFIRARDGNRCTAPYCDAPIRHIDHKRTLGRWRPTEFANGRRLCEFHNHAREPLRAQCQVRKGRHGTHARSGGAGPGSDTGPGRVRHRSRRRVRLRVVGRDLGRCSAVDGERRRRTDPGTDRRRPPAAAGTRRDRSAQQEPARSARAASRPPHRGSGTHALARYLAKLSSHL